MSPPFSKDDAKEVSECSELLDRSSRFSCDILKSVATVVRAKSAYHMWIIPSVRDLGSAWHDGAPSTSDSFADEWMHVPAFE